MYCSHQIPLNVNDFHRGQHLVAVRKSRSILGSDFLLLHDFGAAFIQYLNDRNVYELSSNPTVVRCLNGRLCLSSARGKADSQRDGRVARVQVN